LPGFKVKKKFLGLIGISDPRLQRLRDFVKNTGGDRDANTKRIMRRLNEKNQGVRDCSGMFEIKLDGNYTQQFNGIGNREFLNQSVDGPGRNLTKSPPSHYFYLGEQKSPKKTNQIDNNGKKMPIGNDIELMNVDPASLKQYSNELVKKISPLIG
jgi:hypothetical protein